MTVGASPRPVSDLVVSGAGSRLRGLGLVVLVLATVGLFLVSRGKWSDAIIDSGNQWTVPDALARGDLLYRDLVYWFGPFSPYFQASVFRLFGSSFSSLALAGCLGALAALAALFWALRRVCDSLSSALWTALAIPALVFMPNAGGAIIGMTRVWHAATFALFSVTAACLSTQRARGLAVAGAGALAAMSGLCRTEWGLIALSAAALVLMRGQAGGKRLRQLLGLAAGFLVVFGGVWSFFLVRAGWTAVARDAPVFLLSIPEPTKSYLGAASLGAWKTGSWNLLYSFCVWFGAYLLIQLIALRADDRERARRRLLLLGAALLTALVCAAMGALPGPVLFSAAPLLCLLALVEGWRGGRAPHALALIGFGWMGLIASHRRPFLIDDAPYVAPPLLFAFVCAAGLAFGAVRRESSPSSHRRLSVGFAAALGVLVFAAFAGRALSYSSDGRVPIEGTGGMLSAPAQTARQIEQVAAAVRVQTREGDGFIVFPEGEILNALTGRRNPIRHKVYLPGYVNRKNETEILAELEHARPEAVVLWPRSTAEMGPAQFGEDYATLIRAWIRSHYVERAFGPAGRPPILAVRRRP